MSDANGYTPPKSAYRYCDKKERKKVLSKLHYERHKAANREARIAAGRTPDGLRDVEK
jgi:ribosomal protein L20